MQYIAMEWDHAHSADLIRWVVIECAGIGEEENGAIQALKPRRDIAYFLRSATAQDEAKNFARAKNNKRVHPSKSEGGGRYRAYPWDHGAGGGLLHWAVLQANSALRLGREDVAYFVCETTAQEDALLFETLMNGGGSLDAR
jgi:hypothetical protein